MAKPVFISHAREDAALAEQVCDLLERQGIPCWIAPRDVRPGVHYGEQIIDAIEGAKAALLILSESANTSTSAKREIE